VITEGEAIDSTRYTVQYELLRAQVFGTANDMGPRRGIGLAVLLREGMPGWLKAVDAVMRAAPVLQTTNSPRGDEQPALRHSIEPVSPWRAQLHDVIQLLASLVLSTRFFAEVPHTGRDRSCL
jgi:hypothetical protein